MPPCTWMFICALCTAGAKARCAAMAAVRSNSSSVSAAARAASHTVAVASSVATSRSAQWCLTAWKVPMVRPNCTRSLRVGDGHVRAGGHDADGLGGAERARQGVGAPGCAGEHVGLGDRDGRDRDAGGSAGRIDVLTTRRP